MPDGDTFEPTVATLILMLVWAAMVLGPLFGVATRPRLELMIAVTAIVFTILGRMWDFEAQRVVNLPLPDGGRQEDNDDR